jgi:hypothetical protein
MKRAFNNDNRIEQEGKALTISSPSATDSSGRAGINAEEHAVDIDGVTSYSEEEELSPKDEPQGYQNAITKIEDIANLLPTEKAAESQFLHFLIGKFAQESFNGSSEILFRKIIMSINSASIDKKNILIRKITKEYSSGALAKKTEQEKIQLLESLNKQFFFQKEASFIDPKVIAKKISEIIKVIMTDLNASSQGKSMINLKSKIQEISATDLTEKKNVGGAAIGTSISLIKNLLNGKDAYFINSVLSHLSLIL